MLVCLKIATFLAMFLNFIFNVCYVHDVEPDLQMWGPARYKHGTLAFTFSLCHLSLFSDDALLHVSVPAKLTRFTAFWTE